MFERNIRKSKADVVFPGKPPGLRANGRRRDPHFRPLGSKTGKKKENVRERERYLADNCKDERQMPGHEYRSDPEREHAAGFKPDSAALPKQGKSVLRYRS